MTFRDRARIMLAHRWEQGIAEEMEPKKLRAWLLDYPFSWLDEFERRVWKEEVRRVMRDGLILKTKIHREPDLPGQQKMFE